MPAWGGEEVDVRTEEEICTNGKEETQSVISFWIRNDYDDTCVSQSEIHRRDKSSDLT